MVITAHRTQGDFVLTYRKSKQLNLYSAL